MANLLLGQFESTDWVQVIILILVFGGSALAAVAKKLITAFTPEESEEEPAKIGKTNTGSASAPRRAGPALPVARPLPRGKPAKPRMPAPVALPRPARPLARPLPMPAAPRQPPRPTAAPPARVVPIRPPPPVRTLRPKVEKPKRRKLGAGLGHLTPEENLGHLEPYEMELAHLEHALEDATITRADAPGQIGPIGRPSRRALRHAIIMNEVLGPPVALRPPDDRV